MFPLFFPPSFVGFFCFFVKYTTISETGLRKWKYLVLSILELRVTNSDTVLYIRSCFFLCIYYIRYFIKMEPFTHIILYVTSYLTKRSFHVSVNICGSFFVITVGL